MDYFFTLKDFVDKETKNKNFDTDKVSRDFQNYLKNNFTDAQFAVFF